MGVSTLSSTKDQGAEFSVPTAGTTICWMHGRLFRTNGFPNTVVSKDRTE